MRINLSERDFERIRAVLTEAAGLVFDDCRRDSLSYSLGERLTACGVKTVDEYLKVLTSSPDELQALLNEVTIQETHFFRNPPQFRALRQHVLPQLIKRAAASGNRRLRIWSAGCSTGEEPYSVAMLLRELLPLTDGWDVRIVATDVSTRALEAARVARYGARALHTAPREDVDRWFIKHGDEYVVRPEVRELVELRHHNLVTEPVPFGEPIDLLLCRNVTIYFSRETTRRLMRQFHASLSEGGYLFLGHSETLWQINDEFRLVTLGDAFVYRRDSALSPGAAGADRRGVLPERRTGDDGLPSDGDRRVAKQDRRTSAWEVLTRPRVLPFPRRSSPGAPQGPAPAADALDEVRTALREGRYDDAASLAAAVARTDSMRADAYYLRGLALANLGRDADALVELRKAIYVDPMSGFAHFLLAGVLSRLGDMPGAARSYRAAAETLGRDGADADAAELGGRTVDELVEMCWQLAGGRRA